MAKQSQAEMILTQTADRLAEMVSMDTFNLPGLYQLVKVIMMKRVAKPNNAWNIDLECKKYKIKHYLLILIYFPEIKRIWLRTELMMLFKSK